MSSSLLSIRVRPDNSKGAEMDDPLEQLRRAVALAEAGLGGPPVDLPDLDPHAEMITLVIGPARKRRKPGPTNG